MLKSMLSGVETDFYVTHRQISKDTEFVRIFLRSRNLRWRRWQMSRIGPSILELCTKNWLNLGNLHEQISRNIREIWKSSVNFMGDLNVNVSPLKINRVNWLSPFWRQIHSLIMSYIIYGDFVYLPKLQHSVHSYKSTSNCRLRRNYVRIGVI